MNISKIISLRIKKVNNMKDILNVLSSDRIKISKEDYVEYDLSDNSTEAYFNSRCRDTISELIVSYKNKTGYITFNNLNGITYKYQNISIRAFNESILCFDYNYLWHVDILDESNESLDIENIEINKRYQFKFN